MCDIIFNTFYISDKIFLLHKLILCYENENTINNKRLVLGT